MTLVTVEVVVELMDREEDPVTGLAVTAELMDELAKEGSTVTLVPVGVAVELEEELRVLVKVPVALMVVKTVVVSSIEL